MPPQAHWLVRVVAQVSFFGLIGQLLDSAETTEFLVVGNAVLLATLGTMFSIASTSWERWEGTLPLLVASPTGSVLVFLGRSTFWIPDAVASSLGTFFVCAAIRSIRSRFDGSLMVSRLPTGFRPSAAYWTAT